VVHDCIVSIVTCYGQDCPGLESQWGRDFLQPSRLALGPTLHMCNGYWVPFPRGKLLGHGVNHVPLSSAKVKERVKLYFTPCLGLYLYIINGIFIRHCLLHVSAFQASNHPPLPYQYRSDLGDLVLCNKLKVHCHSTRSLKTICASYFLYQTLLQQAMKQNIIWLCTCITECDLACEWVSVQLVWVCYSE